MMRIIIADDDHSSRDALALALRDEGYEVELAADGVEALAQIDARSPDLLLTDLDMPGITGSEVVARLRDTHPDLPVAVISAQGSPTVQTELIAAGAWGYFVKPFDLEDLVERVARVLGPSPSPSHAPTRSL